METLYTEPLNELPTGWRHPTPETIEAHRRRWAAVARKSGWRSPHRYVQLWVHRDGSIDDSVAWRGIPCDIFLPCRHYRCDRL